VFSRFFLLPLVCFLSLARGLAAEADALAISRNIQNRHMVHGTILDPVFAAADSDAIVSYSRCGDSAIWTGHYLAAEAFRYKVTHSSDALANARRAVAGIKSLIDVTGNNALARCIVPVDSPYRAAISSEEAANGVFQSGPENIWIGNTSRDQYSGVMFGLGVAFEMIDDPELKAAIQGIVERIVEFLRSKDWFVVMPNGSISTTFIGRPDQQLAILQIGREVSPHRFSTAYDISRVLLSPTMIAPISFDVLSDDSYFKFNLDSINLYSLIRFESSSFNTVYRKAYDVLRKHTDDHGNAFFNMIDRALNGPDEARDAATRAMLDDWLKRPRRDITVDLRGKYPACGNPDTACSPIPVAERINTDFLWQRSPFQLYAGGWSVIETAGIDYILPYWMARYYGVIGPEAGARVVSAASGAPSIAPESIATIHGDGLALETLAAPVEPPLSLGGVAVLVKDSAGVSRPARIYYVSPKQVNFVVPAGMASGAATVTVQRTGAVDRAIAAEIRAVAPALFSMDGTGAGVAAATAVRVSSGVATPVEVFSCAGSACAATPMEIGATAPVYLSLFGTGIRGRGSLDGVICTVGGIRAPVQYAGAQPGYAGLDQVNVVLGLLHKFQGEIEVVLTVDGRESNAVRIALR
jgi:uncharacterized protein (TIGR03437 family)